MSELEQARENLDRIIPIDLWLEYRPLRKEFERLIREDQDRISREDERRKQRAVESTLDRARTFSEKVAGES